MEVTRDPRVKAALQLGPFDKIEEVGVFPQPPAMAGESPSRLPETWDSARRASDGELISLGSERSISVEPRVDASLPRGRAKRVDDVPGVIVLEDIPRPKLVLGPVVRSPAGAWIADTRRGPAVLLMDTDGRELAFWGEDGRVRLFVIDRLD